MTKMTEPMCHRCGRCCVLELDGITKKCPHLVNLPSGRTLCRIWHSKDRLGKYIGTIGSQRFHCDLRVKVKRNYEGCEYNREEWE